MPNPLKNNLAILLDLHKVLPPARRIGQLLGATQAKYGNRRKGEQRQVEIEIQSPLTGKMARHIWKGRGGTSSGESMKCIEGWNGFCETIQD
jgi:hypothetical protein